jgi:hypothetical protein
MTSSHETGASIVAPRWSTTCQGDSTDTTPMDLSALGDHVSHCRAASSRFSGLHCLVHAVHAMAASRFVTTLALMAVLIGALLLVL